MEPKYYVPKISEFYVGFEYEYYYNPIRYKIIDDKIQTWEKKVYKGDDFAGLHKNIGEEWKYDVFAQINGLLYLEDLVRVKYLDTSDIESIIHENAKDYHTIFKLRSSYEDELVFQTYWIEENEFLDEEYIYWDIKYDQIKITHKSKTLFWGKIKNVSEFRKVLNMLDIK